jgi:hypothetical protein
VKSFEGGKIVKTENVKNLIPHRGHRVCRDRLQAEREREEGSNNMFLLTRNMIGDIGGNNEYSA